MQTTIITTDAACPDPDALDEAGRLIRAGRLVAFPTETVYGLGGNALDRHAVVRIFAAKGRAATNPLIVHVASADDAKKLAAAWPSAATDLARRFWPGPLTIVLPKRSLVPDEVTAGGSTVGIRVPSHPVALALVRRSDRPIAAPSANRSSRISPTTAAHVMKELSGQVNLVLDAGPTPGGLESTVLDLTTTPPRLLRPGLITAAELAEIVGPSLELTMPSDAIARSPGLSPRHYSPAVPVECVRGSSRRRVDELLARGQRVGWLMLDPERGLRHPNLVSIALPAEPVGYSARLYAALHMLEDADVQRIVVSLPPEEQAWLAVHDRLRRASAR
jgi:L-threonylcarbamoyladenylate synthase